MSHRLKYWEWRPVLWFWEMQGFYRAGRVWAGDSRRRSLWKTLREWVSGGDPE